MGRVSTRPTIRFHVKVRVGFRNEIKTRIKFRVSALDWVGTLSRNDISLSLRVQSVKVCIECPRIREYISIKNLRLGLGNAWGVSLGLRLGLNFH